MKKFLALVVADIDDIIPLEDELLRNATSDPVYENGKQFSGNVLVKGFVEENIGYQTLSEVIISELKGYSEFVSVRKIEFRDAKKSSLQEHFLRAS